MWVSRLSTAAAGVVCFLCRPYGSYHDVWTWRAVAGVPSMWMCEGRAVNWVRSQPRWSGMTLFTSPTPDRYGMLPVISYVPFILRELPSYTCGRTGLGYRMQLELLGYGRRTLLQMHLLGFDCESLVLVLP